MTVRERIDFAWAAGLFEGEGSFSLQNSRTPQARLYLRMEMSSTDQDVLQRFCRIVQIGKVLGPYQGRQPNHKPQWLWTVQGRKVVELVRNEAFRSHLCTRRDGRVTALLAEMAAQPPLETRRARITQCKRGHRLEGDNVCWLKPNANHPSGQRLCRVCRNKYHREYMQKRRETLRQSSSH